MNRLSAFMISLLVCNVFWGCGSGPKIPIAVTDIGSEGYQITKADGKPDFKLFLDPEMDNWICTNSDGARALIQWCQLRRDEESTTSCATGLAEEFGLEDLIQVLKETRSSAAALNSSSTD